MAISTSRPTGQGPGGRAIGARERAWSPGVLGGRRVLYVVDADAMAP